MYVKREEGRERERQRERSGIVICIIWITEA